MHAFFEEFTHAITGFLIGQVVLYLGGLLLLVKSILKKTAERNKRQDEALRSLLQRRLHRDMLRALSRGSCTVMERENIERMYRAYKNLEGNGTIEKIYKRFDTNTKIVEENEH